MSFYTDPEYLFIRTDGVGSGAYPETNEVMAEAVWGVTDSQIVHEQSKKILSGESCLD